MNMMTFAPSPPHGAALSSTATEPPHPPGCPVIPEELLAWHQMQPTALYPSCSSSLSVYFTRVIVAMPRDSYTAVHS